MVLWCGTKVVGIQVVTTSHVFEELNEGSVGAQWERWCHYTGNPAKKSDPENRFERVALVLQQAEDVISAITGFTPQEIMNKRGVLQQLYHGKDSAPFEFELF